MITKGKKATFAMTLRTDVRYIELFHRFFMAEENFRPESLSHLLRHSMEFLVDVIQSNYNHQLLSTEQAQEAIMGLGQQRRPPRELAKQINKEAIASLRRAESAISAQPEQDADEYQRAFEEALRKEIKND